MSSFYSSASHYQSVFEVPEETSFFRPRVPDNVMKRKLSLKLENAEPSKVLRTSLQITDFSMIKELQEAIPSPSTDALVPQLEQLPSKLIELKGSITATIEDLEKFGREGPISQLLGSVPTIQAVDNIEKDFEQSSELHMLDETEPSMNIEEFLRKNSPLSSVSSADKNFSPASIYSGTHSPAHFFEATNESLPTTLEFDNPSNFEFANTMTKNEDVFVFNLPSSSMYSNGESSNPTEERYSQMRRKNNLASKKSRQTRREKEIEKEKEAQKLETENAYLRKKVKYMEEETEKMKKYLLQVVMRRK